MKNKFLESMLEDNSGGISYTRVNCAVWSFAVLFIWVISCIFSLMLHYSINKAQLELVKNNSKSRIEIIANASVITNSMVSTNSINTTDKVNSNVIIDNSNYLPGLPEMIVYILLGFHGAKVAQRFGEKAPEETPVAKS